tara:strand:+ start:316 stop:543 length:228 start_codon:yes stop_codon:yes gene_type:complete
MKLGTYITKLMTTVVDKESDDFVKNLAWDELKRINADIEAFLRKNSVEEDDIEKQEETIKQLLQEDTENGEQSSK